MYELSDKRAAVREVQKFLHLISDVESYGVRRIAVDGIYGEETRAAVSEFQRYMGIYETGLVDLETFNGLYSEYRKAVDERALSNYIITESGFPFTVGDQGDDVINIHLYINELSRNYQDIPSVGRSSYYTQDTSAAIVEIQKIFDTEATGAVTKEFYERLVREAAAIRLRGEIYE